jgi:Tfp pilus assembly protein PilZ
MGAEPIEKTLRLEDNEPSMRESPRKPCLVSANYKIRDEDIRSYILDISIGGVFIETKDPLKIGEAVVITFNLPDSVEPFSVRGAVAWSGPTGFGVKFDPLVPSQGKTIRQYIGIP